MTDAELREKAASALLNLESENQQLREKLASAEKQEHCIKIARKMVDKGLLGSVDDFLEKVAELMQFDDLETFERAVDISVHGLSIGEIDDEEKTASNDSDPVENLILREMTDHHS